MPLLTNLKLESVQIVVLKCLDNNELQKIREEYDTAEQRDEDILKFVYQEVGRELADVDQRYSETITNRTKIQSIFYKLLGM